MNKTKTLAPLGVIFFLSGLAALIYQVSWQRLLFTGIGIDLTSVTLIVSIFMVGLGVGAYFGGRIADRFDNRILGIFCLFEALIGVFGLISYDLISAVQAQLIDANRIEVSLVNFLVLLLPTFMMGSTLPLLTCFYNKYMGNIGASIGALYYVNTAGAAIGSLATGLLFYRFLTLSQTIALAGFINLSIAGFTYYYYTKIVPSQQGNKNDLVNQIQASPRLQDSTQEPTKALWNPKIIYGLAFASGALSLSIEVIWIRIMGFAFESVPQSFSYTLALFLIGIALGATIGKRICEKQPDGITIRLVGQYFLLAGFVDVMVILLAYQLADFEVVIFPYGASLLIIISALVRGIVFPLVHHLGTWQLKSGKQISNVYFSNVVGSSLAPILIGFVLLDWFSTQQIYVLVCLLSLGIGVYCLPAMERKSFRARLAQGGLLVLALSLFLPERLFYTLGNYPNKLIENKHGFIQVYHDLNPETGYIDDYIVYGANVYDGKFNTNLFYNTNGIERAYLLPLIKPDAQEVLVIGLSTGSWVRVLSSMPNLKKMTVIEINPDYVALMKEYAEVAPLLEDKRIEIVVDDGRRWLRRNHQTYDVILMNTTWHWRAYASNLLSQEFLTMVKAHLKPDGIAFYNTTSSIDAYETAQSVFPYVYIYSRMAMVANKALSLPAESEGKTILSHLQWSESGEKLFKTEEDIERAWQSVGHKPFEPYSVENLEKLWKEPIERKPEIIRDNNMITEYKYGKGL
ncbi:MAG: fused MFS/spermidine synthase [Cardiobacteriaceae bacterium]|nr:fused MFS/spermidine synthase [Cardiobacteriaceae bacterium]